MLLGGDLFHENKPSRATLCRAIETLSRYSFAEGRQALRCLTDQAGVVADGCALRCLGDQARVFVGGCAARFSSMLCMPLTGGCPRGACLEHVQCNEVVPRPWLTGCKTEC